MVLKQLLHHRYNETQVSLDVLFLNGVLINFRPIQYNSQLIYQSRLFDYWRLLVWRHLTFVKYKLSTTTVYTVLFRRMIIQGFSVKVPIRVDFANWAQSLASNFPRGGTRCERWLSFLPSHKARASLQNTADPNKSSFFGSIRWRLETFWFLAVLSDAALSYSLRNN